MMKILSHRQRVESTSYTRCFDWEGHVNWGYGFPCNKDGVVDIEKLQPVAKESLQKCLAGFADGPTPNHRLIDRGVREYHQSYIEAAVGECSCGAEVILDGFTNTCDCGRDYNMSGQLLADRSQWGEETGESLDDILSIP